MTSSNSVSNPYINPKIEQNNQGKEKGRIDQFGKDERVGKDLNNRKVTKKSKGLNTKLTNQFEKTLHPDPCKQDPVEKSYFQKSEDSNFLDSNKLLKGKVGDPQVKSEHTDWYVNLALLMSHAIDANDEVSKKRLGLAALHGYSKAATIGEKNSENLGLQTTPFLMEDHRYHRGARNELLDKVREAFAKDAGIKIHEVRILDSPFLKDVIARELPQPQLKPGSLDIDTGEKFNALMDQLFDQAAQGQYPENRVVIDLSKFIVDTPNLGAARSKSQLLEEAFITKMDQFLDQHPQINKIEFGKNLIGKLHLIAFTKHNGHDVMLIPEFLLDPKPEYSQNCNLILGKNRGQHGLFDHALEVMIIESGFCVSPDEAKVAWLKVKNLDAILQEANVPTAELATGGKHFPKILDSCQGLYHLKIVHQFKSLGNPEAAPYLQIMSKATIGLVQGLAKLHPNEGGLDKVFAEHKLTDILQVGYFRILNAMNEAIFKKDDPVKFQNQIELIHQEVQNILAVDPIPPYDEKAFSKEIIGRLTQGKNSIIPKDLGPAQLIKPEAFLKASAMHCVSSILASVEAIKGNNQVNAVLLRDSYYESSTTLAGAKTYNVAILDGDAFNDKGLEAAFAQNAGSNAKPPTLPIDLFVCEFHHNISLTRQTYKPENVIDQIKEMHKKGMLADKCTVAIDTTINLEKSDDFRNLFNDPVIKDLIEKGKLNIVLLRSAQKFDMLGIDNYYGGIAITVNNGEAFGKFNERMEAKEDQLGGLSYQGLAHLQANCGQEIDNYRAGIMANTRLLYSKLPKESIYREGLKAPMQISRVDDDKQVFLDIKFTNFPLCGEAFLKGLQKFTQQNKLVMTSRPSFGFSNMNFTKIDGQKFRLNPGLDSEASLDKYALFFQRMQKCIEEGMNDPTNANLSPKELDASVAKKINSISFK